jgi:hypothetical protein
MIKTYVRVELGSEGESPKQVIERMRKIGAVPVVGDFDFEVSLGEDERLFDRLEEIHKALKGADVRYTITTLTDVEAKTAERGKLITHYVDQKPVELKKALYKAKLERWKDMGLDVAELETLLETDLEKFKAASKDFLRTRLDHMSIVTDRKSEDNVVDGQVLALLDENGISLEDIISTTGFSEEEITLSMGRLISSGSATRILKGQVEMYNLIPPPAPLVRKTIPIVPARDDAEAKKRILSSIEAEGSTVKDIIRTARLPREQVEEGLGKLEAAGKVRKIEKAKKEFFVKI